MTTRINEVKKLVEHISCFCKCKFDSTTCDSNQKWNTVMISINLSVRSVVWAKKL